MSQLDSKSNGSYADSIFKNQDNSRSDGEVQVPGRKPIGNIYAQNEYYLNNNKSSLSQSELNQSEAHQDNKRRIS